MGGWDWGWILWSARDEDEEIRDIKTNDTYEIVQTGKQRKLFILLLTYLVGWLDKYIASGVCCQRSEQSDLVATGDLSCQWN